MKQIKNVLIPGTGKRTMAVDIFFEVSSSPAPAVIYAHGFNGFKDWGNFDIIAAAFAREGFVFVKFNFSHNGTTPEHPEEFADLDAFGNNNYSTELTDLRLITDWVCDPANPYHSAIDVNNIFLIGHSLGGGISLLFAAEDERIKKIVTWAGISECTTPWGDWPAVRMLEWKESGVQYYENSRTKQQMPMYYQLYEDYLDNHERLDIKKAIQSLSIPILICHGSADTAVPLEKALLLKEWQPAAELFTVESDHVFGRKHPWTNELMPAAMQAVLQASARFLKR